MSGESFLAISTGCLPMFSNNSRTHFSNNLAKPAKSSVSWLNSLFIDIEQINFEYTPLSYKNGDPDIKYYDKSKEITFKLENCNSVQCIIKQIMKSLSKIIYIVKHSEDLNGVKIVLASYYSDISIHKNLARLLKIERYFSKLNNHGDEEYYKLTKNVQYISNEAIKLNSDKVSYIDLICEEIEPYFCDSEFKKIVARIDVANKYGETIHMDTLLRRYYKIKASVLETITFELRHPDGRRLLMEEGPPTIVKARIKEMPTKSDFFYLQVNSKPTISHPQNDPGKFTVELPNEIDLKGEWRVALAYAELPPTGGLLRDKKNILLKNIHSIPSYAFSFFAIHKNTKKLEHVYSIAFDRNGVIPYGILLKTIRDASRGVVAEFYVDEDENLYIFSVLKDYDLFLLVTPDDMTQFLLQNQESRSMQRVSFTDVYFNNVEGNDSLFKDLITTHNITINSTHASCFKIDSRPTQLFKTNKFLFSLYDYYPDEVIEEETQKAEKEENAKEEFEGTQNKNEEEEEKLLKIFEKHYDIKRPLSRIPTWMFIYSDFVKPSLIADCYTNVIKLLPYKQKFRKGETIFYTFTPLDFFTINKDSIRTLSFELRSHAGEIHDFRNNRENTSLTLYFERIE
jgi:hypothetical protein